MGHRLGTILGLHDGVLLRSCNGKLFPLMTQSEYLPTSLSFPYLRPEPFKGTSYSAKDLEVILDEEPECMIIQLFNGTVMVHKPHMNAHSPTHWYLFRRRNDVLRVLLALADQGRLPVTRDFEFIFCPRDCTVGGYHTSYDGMPVGPRGIKNTNASSVS